MGSQVKTSPLVTMSISLSLLILFCCLQCSLGGHFLIWCPISAKSVKIGLMAVGEELGRRGHQVTVVSPHAYKKVPPNVTDIVIKSNFLELATRMTDEMLTAEKPPLPPINEMIDLPVLGNEAGYYLAQKKNASLALFLTVPYTTP